MKARVPPSSVALTVVRWPSRVTVRADAPLMTSVWLSLSRTMTWLLSLADSR